MVLSAATPTGIEAAVTMDVNTTPATTMATAIGMTAVVTTAVFSV